MIPFFVGFLTCLSAFFRSRYNLGIEILALRQQLGVLKRKHPRPRLRIQDRIFWILLRWLWPAWSNFLVIVKPETVVAWHRAGFRLFWRLRSQPKSRGRPKADAEVRALIRRMVEGNPTWGAPRIHGELVKLGFDVSASVEMKQMAIRHLFNDAGQGAVFMQSTGRSGLPMKVKYRYHHLGIPTRKKVPGMIEIRRLKVHATDHESNAFGIQWMIYGKDCQVPDLVRRLPHVAFEVDDLKTALKGRKIIIGPNSPAAVAQRSFQQLPASSGCPGSGDTG